MRLIGRFSLVLLWYVLCFLTQGGRISADASAFFSIKVNSTSQLYYSPYQLVGTKAETGTLFTAITRKINKAFKVLIAESLC